MSCDHGLHKTPAQGRIPLSQHLRPLLQRLAAAHAGTKFLSIPGGMCIPNYPDKNIPTLLIYRNGEITGNVVAGLGLNGMKTTVQGESGKWMFLGLSDRRCRTTATAVSGYREAV